MRRGAGREEIARLAGRRRVSHHRAHRRDRRRDDRCCAQAASDSAAWGGRPGTSISMLRARPGVPVCYSAKPRLHHGRRTDDVADARPAQARTRGDAGDGGSGRLGHRNQPRRRGSFRLQLVTAQRHRQADRSDRGHPWLWRDRPGTGRATQGLPLHCALSQALALCPPLSRSNWASSTPRPKPLPNAATSSVRCCPIRGQKSHWMPPILRGCNRALSSFTVARARSSIRRRCSTRCAAGRLAGAALDTYTYEPLRLQQTRWSPRSRILHST